MGSLHWCAGCHTVADSTIVASVNSEVTSMMNRLTIHQVESLPSRAMRHAVAVAIANAVYYIVVSHSCSCHSKSSVTQLQLP